MLVLACFMLFYLKQGTNCYIFYLPKTNCLQEKKINEEITLTICFINGISPLLRIQGENAIKYQPTQFWATSMKHNYRNMN